MPLGTMPHFLKFVSDAIPPYFVFLITKSGRAMTHGLMECMSESERTRGGGGEGSRPSVREGAAGWGNCEPAAIRQRLDSTPSCLGCQEAATTENQREESERDNW